MQGDPVQVFDQAGQRPVVLFWQTAQHLSQLATSLVILVSRLDCGYEAVVKGEGTDRIGKLPEVHLEQRGH